MGARETDARVAITIRLFTATIRWAGLVAARMCLPMGVSSTKNLRRAKILLYWAKSPSTYDRFAARHALGKTPEPGHCGGRRSGVRRQHPRLDIHQAAR